MAIEIERKFLVTSDAWRAGATPHAITQGYLAREPHRTVRVRLRDEEAWMTVKGPTTGISREEVEFILDHGIARELLALCLDGRIEKTRHELWQGGMLWEIDEFHGSNAGLIVAEVELPDAAHAIERPSWLGAEVSHDLRFSNSQLARRPWLDWTDEERAAVMTLAQGR
jgi:CYTH domain-containing protein